MSSHIFFPTQFPIVALIGPTAIGKTALSIELAKEFDFEIISVDSMQVYRYMDIGTAKISREEMDGIPHHLIDVVDPDEPFSAGHFENQAIEAIKNIIGRGKNVLLTGGTGLYLSALLNGLSENLPSYPEIKREIESDLSQNGANVLHQQLALVDRISAKRIHMNDSHRLVRALEIFRGTGKTWSSYIEEHQRQKQLRFKNTLLLGLTCQRSRLYERIAQRSTIMLNNGLRDEVEGLLDKGYGSDLRSMNSIGYSHMVKLLQKEWSEGEMLEKLTRDTRRYAKRQYTWFNKISDLKWLDQSETGEAKTLVETLLSTSKQ